MSKVRLRQFFRPIGCIEAALEFTTVVVELESQVEESGLNVETVHTLRRHALEGEVPEIWRDEAAAVENGRALFHSGKDEIVRLV